MIADARTAVVFLTRIPLRDTRVLGPTELSRAAAWFPAVGLLVGGVMGGTRALAGLALTPTTATVLAVLVTMLVTGALHEDGLADTADAAGAHTDRARKLEILRDPRVGTYGALALVFAFVFAVATLAPLSDDQVLRAALVAHVLARWSTLPSSRLPTARPDGSGALVRAGWGALAAGTLTAGVTALLAGGLMVGAMSLAVAAVVTSIGSHIAVRAFGGMTGDTFGAVNKLVELATYATLAAMWS